MQEIWKDIKGLEGLYQISNLGRVKSLSRFVKVKNYYIFLKERILKPSKGKYKRINLNYKSFSVHRLVAEAFIPNPNNYPVINHIDGNKYNNNVSNLEWCTQGYNQKEAYRLGLRQPTMHNLGETGKLCPNSKPVYQFNKNGVFIKYYDGASEAGRQTGISKYDISACCRNIQKTAGGYIWRYANK